MSSFRDPGEEVGGGHHRDRRTDEAFEVAGDDGIEPGFHGERDLQVVLEVGTWHGMSQFQGLPVNGDDIEQGQAFGNNLQGLGEVGGAPHYVKDRGYGCRGHMPDDLSPMIRREHRRRVREPGGTREIRRGPR